MEEVITSPEDNTYREKRENNNQVDNSEDYDDGEGGSEDDGQPEN